MEKKKKNEKQTELHPEAETETEVKAEACENTEEVKEAVPDPAEEKIKAMETELSETRDRYLRMAAEYENYRKRSAKERENIYADATSLAISAILPVYDNLERAAAQPTEDEAFMQGVKMTLAQFTDALAKLGVKEISALGEQFDPNLHNAVMHVEQEGCDDNTVVEVFQKGFIMGDRVVRHAMVKVAN